MRSVPSPERSATHEWIACLPGLCAFALVYAASLTFVYVEGDDAASIAHHALGRDRLLQPPYAAYQGAMDLMLRPLPADEALLRVAAISSSAVSVLVMYGLIIRLGGAWLGREWATHRSLALAALLACPETFYLGLVYVPSTTALCLVLGAHLVCRRALHPETDARGVRLALSAVLYGLGAAARWDVAPYGAIIALDAVLGIGAVTRPSLRWRLGVTLAWGVVAIGCWYLWVLASGYSWRHVIEALEAARTTPPAPWSHVLVRLQPMVTPAFLLFGAMGLVVLAQRVPRAAAGVLAALALALPWLWSGSGFVPRKMLLAFPGTFIAVVVGFSRLWAATRASQRRLAFRGTLLGLLLVPWLVGISATHPDFAYGPGFGQRAFDRPRERVGWEVSPTLGAGSWVPTSEGPRALWGHAWVLLAGGWRAAVLGLDEERMRAYGLALARGVNVLHQQGQDLFVVAALRLGLRPEHERNHAVGPSGSLRLRRFVGPDGRSVLVFKMLEPDDLLVSHRVRALATRAGSPVVFYGFTSQLRRLHLRAPETLEPLGPASALLDLDHLHAALACPAHGPQALPDRREPVTRASCSRWLADSRRPSRSPASRRSRGAPPRSHIPGSGRRGISAATCVTSAPRSRT